MPQIQKSQNFGIFVVILFSLYPMSEQLNLEDKILELGLYDFIKKNKISSSDGEAFRLSGEGLDQLM